MAELEAVGDVLTGGIIGRAIEPAAGEAESGRADESAGCLNCGASYRGNFCNECGQKRRIHRNLSAIGHDLIHGILHLDGKLWRTLPMLSLRPGELTRRYIHGERAKFVSPFAMFLFSVFVMFAVLQVNGFSSNVELASPTQLREDMVHLRRELTRELAELREDRIKVNLAKIAKPSGAAKSVTKIDARIAELQQEIATLDELRTRASRLGSDKKRPTVQIGLGRLNGDNYVIEEFDKNPRLALYRLQSNGYKFSWLLIPISVPFMWLLFLGNGRFRLYDHMVFVTYSMTFMSLLMTLASVMGFLGAHAAVKAITTTLIPPVHMFLQLKGAYGLRNLGAFVRTVVLAAFCLLVTTIYLTLLLAMIG